METDTNKFKTFSTWASGAAMGSAAMTSFTVGFPVATGALVTLASIGSVIAAVNYYKSLEEEKKRRAEIHISNALPPQR